MTLTIKEQTRVKLLNEVNEGVLTAGEAARLLGISLRSAPQTPEEIITWLEHAVAAWNEDPTPFTRGGKRKERRDCVRQWELVGSNPIVADHQLNMARPDHHKGCEG